MRIFTLFATISLLLTTLGGVATGSTGGEPAVSGRVVHGLRQIEIPSGVEPLDLHVYRGDYVQLIPADGAGVNLEIPALSITAELPLEGEKPYLKFKEAGVFPLTMAERSGAITVHNFTRSNYFEMKAAEAAQLIESVDPLVLDVRTQFEFSRGHLQDAVLLPVRSLQKRIGELKQYRDRPILIYCRSGNRSTVAAKILLDNGFERVYNLRHGIKEWNRDKLPTVK